MAAAGLGRAPLLLRYSSWRNFTSQTDGESRLARVLREKFPRASAIKVVDISGGCGAMYEIHIESEEFREKRTVQQHQMVNQCLGTSKPGRQRVKHLLTCLPSELPLKAVFGLQALSEEIKHMHGLRIFTSTPKT